LEWSQSKADFYAKLNISLKEASETEYWLELLHESNFIETSSFESVYADCQEIRITNSELERCAVYDRLTKRNGIQPADPEAEILC